MAAEMSAAMRVDAATVVRTTAGALLWGVFAVYSGGDWWREPANILLMGMLVVTPAGLGLARSPSQASSHLYRTGRFLQPFAALIAGAAFLIPPGVLAGTLAIAWLPAAALPAVSAAQTLRQHGARNLEEILISISLLYLPAAGLFFWFQRLGFQPGDGLLTTALHFHFAGFGGLLLAGCTGRAARQAHSNFLLTLLKLISGPLLVAPLLAFLPDALPIGYRYAGWAVQLVGALGLGLVLIFSSLSLRGPAAARGLLFAAGAAGLIAGSAGGAAAAGAISRTYFFASDALIILHGWLFGAGSILTGLSGWTLFLGRREGS